MTIVDAAESGGEDALHRPNEPDLRRRPPRLLFHGVVSLLAVLYLVAFSGPGIDFGLWVMCTAALGLAALVRAIRGVIYAVHRGRGSTTGTAWWFVVAPLGGVLVWALLVGNVPLHARWAASEHSFDHAVRTASFSPGRIGLYSITSVVAAGDGWLFYERNGNLFDDAGFAYLPHGPDPSLGNSVFENPSFVHLHGPWYAWTASW